VKTIFPNYNSNSHGFTLIEVLVATFVVAIALVALAGTVQSVTREQSNLSTKFFANIVASNKMAELQALPQWPELGESDEDTEMVNLNWFIEMEVTETAVDTLRRVDLKVGLISDEQQVPETVLSGFVGQTPQIGGNRVAWTQLDPTLGSGVPNDDGSPRDDNDPDPDDDTIDPTPIPIN